MKNQERRARIENKILTAEQTLMTSTLHVIEIYTQRTTATIFTLKNTYSFNKTAA